jgi:hypothetical protein
MASTNHNEHAHHMKKPRTQQDFWALLSSPEVAEAFYRGEAERRAVLGLQRKGLVLVEELHSVQSGRHGRKHVAFGRAEVLR